MNKSRTMMGTAYTGGIAAVAALVANKLVHGLWKAATGERPPEPSDPETPVAQAVLWVIASAIGIGLIQLLANRFAARRLSSFIS